MRKINKLNKVQDILIVNLKCSEISKRNLILEKKKFSYNNLNTYSYKKKEHKKGELQDSKIIFV